MQRMLNLALFCEYLLSLFKKWQFTIYVHFKIGKLPFAYLRTTYINICIFGILNVIRIYYTSNWKKMSSPYFLFCIYWNSEMHNTSQKVSIMTT